jgi:hypothetical protein
MAGGATDFEDLFGSDQSYLNTTSSPSGSGAAPTAVLSSIVTDAATEFSAEPSIAGADVNSGDQCTLQFSATVSAGGSAQNDANAIVEAACSGQAMNPNNVAVSFTTPGPPAAYTASVTLTALSSVDSTAFVAALAQAIINQGGQDSAWYFNDPSTGATEVNGTLLSSSNSPGSGFIGASGWWNELVAWVEGIFSDIANWISNLFGVAASTASSIVWALVIGIVSLVTLALIFAAYHPDTVKHVADVAGGAAVAPAVLA